MAAAAQKEDEDKARARQETLEDFRAHREDMRLHPEIYLAQRRKLLDAMATQPGFVVSGKQYFRFLEYSNAPCGDDPASSFNFTLVRVASGPMKGRVGWVCDRDAQRIGAWVL